MLNGGQSCIAANVFLVESIYDGIGLANTPQRVEKPKIRLIRTDKGNPNRNFGSKKI